MRRKSKSRKEACHGNKQPDMALPTVEQLAQLAVHINATNPNEAAERAFELWRACWAHLELEKNRERFRQDASKRRAAIVPPNQQCPASLRDFLRHCVKGRTMREREHRLRSMFEDEFQAGAYKSVRFQDGTVATTAEAYAAKRMRELERTGLTVDEWMSLQEQFKCWWQKHLREVRGIRKKPPKSA